MSRTGVRPAALRRRAAVTYCRPTTDGIEVSFGFAVVVGEDAAARPSLPPHSPSAHAPSPASSAKATSSRASIRFRFPRWAGGRAGITRVGPASSVRAAAIAAALG
jgi:hypothetical protein